MLVIGSAYMIWIGYTLARSAIVIDGIEASKLHRTARIFTQGLVTCLLNPKAWFVHPRRLPAIHAARIRPLLAAGACDGGAHPSVAGSFYGGLALAAAKGRTRWFSKPEITIWIGRAAGWLLVVVAALMLAEGWRSW